MVRAPVRQAGPLVLSDPAHPVALVDEDADRLEHATTGIVELGVGAGDHEVVDLDEVGGGAVDADLARAPPR